MSRIYILTDDGRTLWQLVLYYQRLRNATPEQRAHWNPCFWHPLGGHRWRCIL